jgi:methylated-DNA-[protein]-cysteine S-methyltransferase
MRPTYRSCRAIEPDLVAVGAREAGASAAERVAEHVRDCGSCRVELERYRAVDDAVGAMRGTRLAGDDPTLARAELESRLADLRSRIVTFGVHASALGPILLGRTELGVSLVRYLEGGSAPLGPQVQRAVGDDAVEDRAATEALAADLADYLAGRRSRLDWPLDLRRAGSAFQRRVLEATARLPYGGVTSYAGIAREVGAPRAVRPVAQALRHNPLPIVIPCHRVVGNTGALVGYAGSRMDLKQRLLAVEGVPTDDTPRDPRVPRERMDVRYLQDAEYCVPSCGSLPERPLADLTLFGSRRQAEAAGLGPCSSCRPDLHPIAS